MMRIDIRSNLTEVLGYTARINPQFRFAASLALTRLVQQARTAEGAALNSALDRPTPFTKGGLFITPARKDNLEASVGIKDKQAGYLGFQVRGGTRAPTKVALRLPTTAQLNEYGNLPAGAIKQLIARAKAGKRATKRQASRFGVSKDLDLFYGDPKDGRPAGIYKRVALSPTQHRLVPIIVFPKRSARYSARFDFYGTAERTIRANARTEIAAAWKQAIRTAR